MKSLLGLDIGSHSIKIVEVAKDGKNPVLLAAGSIPTPPGALTSSKASDQEAIAIAVKRLLKDIGAKSQDANIALPEAQVFTRVIEVPQLSPHELASAMRWEAEQYIPLPLDQVNLDFTILRDSKQTGKKTMEALLVAAPKALIDKYLTILELSDISPVGVETEIIAATRTVVATTQQLHTILVASLGAQTTDLAIVEDGILAFTRSIPSGGEALSRALAQKLEFDISQAEEYKKTYGLETNKLEGKIVEAAKPIMDTIIAEMKRAVAFYTQKHPNRPVEVIVLSGGTANVPGMVVYIASEMNIETQLINPWSMLTLGERFSSLGSAGAVFAVAVGLAIRV